MADGSETPDTQSRIVNEAVISANRGLRRWAIEQAVHIAPSQGNDRAADVIKSAEAILKWVLEAPTRPQV